MPLRGLLPFRTGIDVIKIYRLKQICSSSTEAYHRFLNKIFTSRELAAIQGGGRLEGPTKYQFLASRWAAKEATIKTSPRKIFMRDIEIYTRPSGAPFGVILDSRALPPDPISSDPPVPSSGPPPTDDASEASPRARHSVHDSLAPGDRESEGLTARKPRFVGEEWSLVAEPGEVQVEGRFVELSVSHDGDYCVAVAVVRGDLDGGSVGRRGRRGGMRGGSGRGLGKGREERARGGGKSKEERETRDGGGVTVWG
ncbi:hypothetical protein BDZ85DRAFT_281649 [Elsinoe ampelina]|uniref:4'-phosphopantetheinyl transferase domain-containing protein n=1 Tax=Elsinoe ampelina TaxID=302913 RepID=A0A6A6GDL5_9PEZI|nr:hypothetical protein BDZ85DRAFT_281649 [Elsinoe ampelina]